MYPGNPTPPHTRARLRSVPLCMGLPQQLRRSGLHPRGPLPDLASAHQRSPPRQATSAPATNLARLRCSHRLCRRLRTSTALPRHPDTSYTLTPLRSGDTLQGALPATPPIGPGPASTRPRLRAPTVPFSHRRLLIGTHARFPTVAIAADEAAYLVWTQAHGRPSWAAPVWAARCGRPASGFGVSPRRASPPPPRPQLLCLSGPRSRGPADPAPAQRRSSAPTDAYVPGSPPAAAFPSNSFAPPPAATRPATSAPPPARRSSRLRRRHQLRPCRRRLSAATIAPPSARFPATACAGAASFRGRPPMAPPTDLADRARIHMALASHLRRPSSPGS